MGAIFLAILATLLGMVGIVVTVLVFLVMVQPVTLPEMEDDYDPQF